MRLPKLDFIQQDKAQPRLGLLVLGLGVALLLSVMTVYEEIQESVAQERSLQARLMKSVAGSRTSGQLSGGSQERSAAGLIAMLERTLAKEIQLLEFEMSATTGIVQLKAQAATAQEMLDFLTTLRGQQGVRDLALMNHRAAESGSGSAIEFSARMSWGGK